MQGTARTQNLHPVTALAAAQDCELPIPSATYTGARIQAHATSSSWLAAGTCVAHAANPFWLHCTTT